MSQINTLDKQLSSAKVAEFRISDHAVVRFLERVEGLDIDAVKHDIVPEKVMEQLEELGYSNGVYPVNKTHKVRVKDRTVVTILDMG
jgi:hypothetical protein